MTTIGRAIKNIHIHQWERAKRLCSYYSMGSDTMVYVYDCKCTICGKIKKKQYY